MCTESESIIARVISLQPSLSYFHKVLNPEITKLLNSSSALTLFLPVDDAWDSLNPYERLYLESEYAADDLKIVVNMHAVLETGVRYSDSFNHRPNRKFYDLLISSFANSSSSDDRWGQHVTNIRLVREYDSFRCQTYRTRYLCVEWRPSSRGRAPLATWSPSIDSGKIPSRAQLYHLRVSDTFGRSKRTGQ